jgi:hypothetical protein
MKTYTGQYAADPNKEVLMTNRRHGWIRILFIGVVVFGLAVSASAPAQQWEIDGASVDAGFTADGRSPAYYGISDVNNQWVNASEFTCGQSSLCDWQHWTAGFWQNAGPGAVVLRAQVDLPPGALVTGISVAYYDNSDVAGEDLAVRLYRCWVRPGGAGATVLGSAFVSPYSPDYTVTFHDIDPDVTVEYYLGPPLFTRQSYMLDLLMPATTAVGLRGVIVHWFRQVSPAPATATFGDVPTGHPFFQFVEALVESGITAGCGGGNYCPDDPLTRGQMAVFLSAALGLHWAP